MGPTRSRTDAYTYISTGAVVRHASLFDDDGKTVVQSKSGTRKMANWLPTKQ